MEADQRLGIRIRQQDRERLELIQHTLGLSKSSAVRVAIAALCRQMGYDKEFPDGFLKKK
jgi:hypothetical protein